ncbi:conjugal transfer protein TraC (plasmid) [Paenibacillus polymyxa SC2]|uniref:Conjugal transfer protein TraC n=1 Tax=Paenibacillus polymyxa (strain SC2) TaxID=886882 RepID=E3EKV4_PAEPS|nr:conjugal transfer protein TraC [Paenibacillus polymyxa SC2]
MNAKEKPSQKSMSEVSVLGKGIRTVKDLFAPPSFDRGNESYMKVGNKYVRSFIMNGFPANVSVGWLDQLFNYDGDMDTAIYVEPTDERTALDELTAKITQFEAQLQMEYQKGNIKNITRLKNNVTQLYDQRERLERNYENLFHVQIASNLYTDSVEELEKETQKLDNKLKGRKIFHMPVYLRQDDGYKTVLPFGKSYIPDKFRNFNSGALTACFPFYNSEISHATGVFLGVNISTMTPMLVDFYDRDKLLNGNLTVFGQAGSGKTFLVSMLTLRSALKGVRTVIIDPEGEYKKLTKAVGGSHIYIAPDSRTHINPFDLEESELTDEEIAEGKPEVDIKGKVSDVLNLIAVMAGGLNREEQSSVSSIINEVYQDQGFNETRQSLYVTEPIFNEDTGEFYHDGVKKPMPTFSTFHNKLVQWANEKNNDRLTRLANALNMFKKGGVYDMFDCQTSDDLKDFKNSPIVTFDISRLEESVLRPIGMYIALSWTWEKFIKKNPEIKKRIVCDEAWMLVNKNMAGFEYTAQFLENAARRIRKRNGGLLVASQNFVEFANNDQGKAVLTNAVTNIFLRQDATDIDAVQDTFKLSDGERNFLLSAKKGEFLIKMNGESSVAYAMSFPYEKELISKAYVSKD